MLDIEDGFVACWYSHSISTELLSTPRSVLQWLPSHWCCGSACRRTLSPYPSCRSPTLGQRRDQERVGTRMDVQSSRHRSTIPAIAQPIHAVPCRSKKPRSGKPASLSSSSTSNLTMLATTNQPASVERGCAEGATKLVLLRRQRRRSFRGGSPEISALTKNSRAKSTLAVERRALRTVRDPVRNVSTPGGMRRSLLLTFAKGWPWTCAAA